MKIRKGYISNSSASSFMIGIAKVTDEELLRKYIVDNNIDYVKITKVKDAIINAWDFKMRNNEVILESFMNDVRTKVDGQEDTIVYLDFMNGDDSDFWDGDNYDYDIDLDFFEEKEIKSYNLFHQKNIGIINPDTSFGAGRNG